jgi:hypothetical protein
VYVCVCVYVCLYVCACNACVTRRRLPASLEDSIGAPTVVYDVLRPRTNTSEVISSSVPSNWTVVFSATCSGVILVMVTRGSSTGKASSLESGST